MALLSESVESKKMDVRLIERNIARGVVSSADYQKSVEQLPDDSENADYVNVDQLQGQSDEGSSKRSNQHH